MNMKEEKNINSYKSRYLFAMGAIKKMKVECALIIEFSITLQIRNLKSVSKHVLIVLLILLNIF